MDWHPLSEEQLQHYPPYCIRRIKRDMMAIMNEPPPGIIAISDDSDITLVHALITGTEGTPYEGGFFYFLVRYPPDYPIKPPKVKFMTTGGSTVRFNPNLYRNGKVCLSILGTWDGPTWSPAQTLSSVLISIQSLLCDAPYHNEPGFETKEIKPGDVKRYNEIIQHETMRVAVVGMVDNDFGLNLPSPFQEAIKTGFLEFYNNYEKLIKNKMDLNGIYMRDPFGEKRGIFQWANILERLENIHSRLKNNSNWKDMSPSSSPSLSDA